MRPEEHGLEELWAAVEGHLELLRRSDDPEAALAFQITRDMNALEAIADTDSDMRSQLLLGWLHWYRSLALPEGRKEADLRAAIDMLTGCFATGTEPDRLPAPLLPLLVDRTASLAVHLHEEALRSLDPGM